MAIQGALLDAAVNAAEAYGLDEDVFLSQVMQESGFDPAADSGQAQGISQFTPETAASIGINPAEPIQSLYGQAALMRSYLERYNGSYPLALAAYNAGPGAVDKAGGVPDFPETQQYVSTILGHAGGSQMATSAPTAEPTTTDQTTGPTDWAALAGGGGAKPTKLPTVNGLGIQSAAELAVARGYKGLGQGEGFGALFAGPDGQPVTLEAIVKQLTGAGAAKSGGTPTTRSIGGTLYQYDPASQTWNPAAGGAGAVTRPSLTQNPEYQQVQIAKTASDIAQAKVAQNWLVQKQLFEQAQGLRKEAADTQTRITDLGVKIGQLAQNPIDRGAEAATILGNSAWGASNRASEITNDSLIPLQGLLNQRQQAFGDQASIDQQAQQATAASNAYNPQTGVFPTTAPPPTPAPAAPPAPAATPLPSTAPVLPPSALTQPTAGPSPTPGTPNTPTGLALPAVPPGVLPHAADGGEESGAYISGERGPEINIPTADGAIVINAEQAKHLGINLDKLKKYADGGIFNLGTPKPVQPGSIFGDEGLHADTSLARGFLQKSLQRATAGTPFKPDALPSPAYASTPGMSPDVVKLLAGLNAMAGLYSPEEYQRLASIWSPQGITATNIGRAA